nr:hypothetical protein [Candidatus Enterousia merdequi]
KMFGASKTQLIDTAVGAAAGAGIMAASTYSGKVAGDTIKSTAVNAASGMVVGNMLAGTSGSDSVLATTKCKISTGEKTFEEKDCIIGTCATTSANKIENGKMTIDSKESFYFISKNCNEIIQCTKKKENSDEFSSCSQVAKSKFIYTMVQTTSGQKLCSDTKDSDYSGVTTYSRPEDSPTTLKQLDGANFVMIESASEVEKSQHAYAVVDLKIKPLGYKQSDLQEILNNNPEYYLRNSDGTVGALITADCNFQPSSRDASDGALVDLSNEARAKGTMAGAAVGGAMGGFTAYQGAKSEISERWVTAVREYEDSLSNFVCVTGTRFLSKYNDYLEVPELKKPEKQQ